MRFMTRNTLYTLTDCGDGAFLIQGHDRYCPRPILVSLAQPVETGKIVAFTYREEPPVGVKRTVLTSPVQWIEDFNQE